MSAPGWAQLERLQGELGDLLEQRQGQERDPTPYASDPVGFVRDVLGETTPGPWAAQVEVAEAVRDHPLVCVAGCNASGKDWTAARLALWWCYAVQGLALVTGPTQRQVTTIAMGEVARAFAGGDLQGELYTNALRIGGREEQRGILAFVSSDVSKLTGFHAPRVLVVVTEAQGVDEYVWEGLFSCATGDEDRVLAVGNPLSPTGRFYEAHRSDSWRSISISAEDHPNLQEGRAVVPGGPTRLWAERIAQEYGRESGTYRARVLGEFPASDDEGLFRADWLAAANRRHELEQLQEEAQAVVAVDPARYGPDATVCAVRRAHRLEKLVEWRGASTVETADRVAQLAEEAGVTPRRKPGPWRKGQEPPDPRARGRIVVDAVGVGGGVADALSSRGFNVTEFNGGERPTDRRFANRRAESYWRLRQELEDGGLALPEDRKLADELLALRWSPTADGRIQLEGKEELRGRIGRSPDRADAVAMAFSAETGAGASMMIARA